MSDNYGTDQVNKCQKQYRILRDSSSFKNSCCFMLRAPPTSLLPNSHYEKLASAFGGHGYFVTTQAELSTALKDVFSCQRSQPVIINAMIDSTSQRKSQVRTAFMDSSCPVVK